MDCETDDGEDWFPQDLRDAWDQFLHAVPPAAHVNIIYAADVDGLCSAALMAAGLSALGHTPTLTRYDDTGRCPTAAQAADAVVVLCDACDEPADGAGPTFKLPLSHATPDTPTVRAWTLWVLLEMHTDVQGLIWLAAVALMHHFGPRCASPFMKLAKARHTAKSLRQVLTWCTLAPHGEVDLRDHVLVALQAHKDPKSLSASTHPSVVILREAEAAILGAQEAVSRTTPHLAGHLALIRVRTACQIQSLIAAQWSERLPGYVVLVANENASRVRLATRSASRLDIDDFFRSLSLPADFVTDGEVLPDTWQEVLLKCGVAEATS